MLSQKRATTKYELLQEYRSADQAYSEAVRAGNAKNLNEKTEDRLNQLALDRFAALNQKLNDAPLSFDSLLFFTTYKIGELHQYFLHEKEALNFYQQAIRAKQKTTLADSFLFKPFLYTGIILYNQNRFDSALSLFHAAEQVQARYPRPLDENQRLYNTLGALYFATGNYSTAKIYFQKALDVLSSANPSYQDLSANYYINLASAHVMLEEYDEANRIYQNLLPLRLHQNEIYHNLGVISLNLGALKKALSFFQQVQYNNNRQVRLCNDIGFTHFNAGRFDSARFYYAKATVANGTFYDSLPNVSHGITLHYQGKLAMAGHAIDSALAFYQNAIHQFYPAYRNASVRSNPQHFTGVFSYINLFDVMIDKAAALDAKYARTKNRDWLIGELETFEAAFRLVDYVEKTYNSDEARLFLGKIKYSNHDKPISIACHLYKSTGDQQYLQRAYELDQKTKASVLAYNILRSTGSRPSALLENERRVKTEITRLSLKAQQLTDAGALAAVNTAIRNQEIALGKIQERRSLENPSFSVDIPAIEELQRSMLDDRTQLLSYHLSYSAITIFSITKKQASCTRKELYAGFQKDLAQMVAALHGNETANLNDSVYYRLYDFLLGSIAQERAIIVPDDALYALPFEALKNSRGEFFVEKHSVQYLYSTALLRREVSHLAGASTVAFAPFSSRGYEGENVHFARLKMSATEFNTNNATTFVDARASKKAFLAQVQNGDILHFATHAAVDKDNDQLSFIAFSPAGAKRQSDYLLYAEEIGNLPLKRTKLVILSACETGAGDLVRGEGVMSLSRAFAYAGCPNTVASLWQADDVATSYLVKHLHVYLQKGMSIDKALQQAKKDYLADRQINPRFKAPVYWAHLVFVGNYAPEKDLAWWWYAAGLLLVSSVVLLFLRRRKLKRKADLR